MLSHPVIQQLRALKLDGMALALQEQQEQPSIRELSFEERLTLLVDREQAHRDTRSLQRRLLAARLKVNATLEEVDVKHPRGLDAKLLRSLAEGQWITEKRGVIITGPTGVGKTFIGCALAQVAKVDVLILDDWGLDVPTAEGRRILLEVLDDRYEHASTIITSQFPTSAWHTNLGDPTLADAILDRVLHHAYRIELKGESLRKRGRRLSPEAVSLS